MALDTGTPGNDDIRGTAGDDVLFGGDGADTIHGGDGNDVLSSAALVDYQPLPDWAFDVDYLYGEGGDDQFLAGWGDYIDGGSGYDFFVINYDALSFGVNADFRGLAGQLFTAGGLTLTGVESAAYIGGTEYDDFIATDGVAVYGHLGNDHIIGAGELYGEDGNDLIEIIGGGAGSAYGGADSDTLVGGAGFDTLSGGNGSDLLLGAGLNDSLDGGDGNDTIVGTAYADTIDAGGGNDSVVSDAGNDRISAGAGNDTIDASGAGSKTVDAGEGDDLVYAGNDASELRGGAGNDTLSYEKVSYAVHVYLEASAVKQGNFVETISGFEGLVGSAFDDMLTAAFPPYVQADHPNQTIAGGGGNDIVYGGYGNDLLYGDGGTTGAASGDDTIQGSAGDDTIDGGAGTDTAVFSLDFASYGITYRPATDTFTVASLNGFDGNDTLVAIERLQFSDGTWNTADLKSNANGAGDDSITGTSGADSLDGHAGNDTIAGGAGNDTLCGGVGNDVLDGGAGIDTASFHDASGRVHVDLAITGAQDTGVGRDTLTGIENVRGGDWGNDLYGDSGPNVLEAGANALQGFGPYMNVLDGRGGADTMIGTSGYDTFYVDDAGDVVIAQASAGYDKVVSRIADYSLPDNVEILQLDDAAANGKGNAQANQLLGNAAANHLEGLDGNDTLVGNGGADTLDGGAGNDTLFGAANTQWLADAGNLLVGGAGDDSLVGASGNDTLVGNSSTDASVAGSDTIEGGDGDDTAVFAGRLADYAITKTLYDVKVSSATGTDVLHDVESIRFADQTLAVSAIARTDTTPPQVANVYAAPGFVLHMTFNEGVQPGDGMVTIRNAQGSVVEWIQPKYQMNGGTSTDQWINVSPYVNAFSTTYTVEIASGAFLDAAGNPFGGGSFSFTTAPDPIVRGSNGNDTLFGSAGDDTMDGGAGNDVFHPGKGQGLVYGGPGVDTVVIDGASSAFHYAVGGYGHPYVWNNVDTYVDLYDVERLRFDDIQVAFDIDGNAGKAYRLYQAAFNRKPDLGGLGYQMHDLDTVYSLEQVASNFIASPEFQATYGNVDNTQFITLLYANVLHRAPDAGGLQYHLGEFANGESRALMLIHFSESPENQANVIGDIASGMVYIW